MSENIPGGSVPPQNEPPAPPPVPPTPPTPPTPPPAAPVPPPAAPVPPAAPPTPPVPPAAPPAAPPPGGYAPPPPGYAAPPPPAAGYGYAPAPSGTDIVMDGVKYGWKKFTENVGPWIIGGLVWLFGLGIIASILWFAVFAAAFGTSNYTIGADGTVSAVGGGLGFFGFSIFFGVVMLLAVLVQAAFLNAALHVSAGNALQVGDFFKFPNFGKVFTTALLVGLAEGVGFALCYIPGLIVMFFFSFAIIFALDRGLGAVDSIKASIDLVKNNVGTVLLTLLGVWIVTAIGSAICGIGIIAAYPIAYVLLVYVYRRIQNQEVAP